jgi:predicted dehydrogenase
VYLGQSDGKPRDNATIQLRHADGSSSTIQYLSNGHKSFPKERIEVFANGDIVTCDNFRVSKSLKLGKQFKTRTQDKGHQNEMESFVNAITSGGKWPIPAEELLEVSRVTIDLAGQA